ncbi:MAG: hypothetical protein A3F46_10855 [Legionellales bacterium RIFCSPHIGHO2_12_FULL_42_9]|nr:MAG: hypothetical protein A3F46_10855 [Legionellales bacterium RIFCSPHIGHO2_12_FULL_42_9]
MKTMLRAGMLSVLITCAFSAEAAGSQDLALKGANLITPSQVSEATAKIDLNKAEANELAHSIKGIGVKRAEAIVKYREAHGAFKSIADLAYVPGVGSNFVKKNNAKLEQVFKVN